MIGGIYFLGFMACVPLANWLIGNVGTTCVPNGPCLIPVAPGISAPSGVLAIGAALVLRDLLQNRLGAIWSLVAVLCGAAVSAFIAPPALVIASTAAFLFSELADLGVYTPLRKRGLIFAVLASSTVGLVVDSVLFLTLAFNSLDYLPGQILGKLWAVLVAIPVIHLTTAGRAALTEGTKP